ncbi:MAG: GTPase Era [Thermodesulfobacteriota bacterium]
MKGGSNYKEGFKSGFVSIIGAPNVGKSTLLNLVLGEKISIVSDKPQTTRNRITGIKNLKDAQIVFLDTPGIHQDKKRLNRIMVRNALTTLKEVDIIIFMVEANRPFTRDEKLIIPPLESLKLPVLLVINKVDLVEDKASLMPVIDRYSTLYPFKEIIPVSCLKAWRSSRDNSARIVVKSILKYLPPGPPHFPQDMMTDRTERFLVGEMIREKVFQLTKQEIPYSTVVTIDKFKEDLGKGVIHIMATINIERSSQKGIVIGKGGQMLKRVGTMARKDMERLLGSKVFLELWVRVQEEWSSNSRVLRELGYN